MSPLANQDPLAQLNDIIAPSTPSWFPPAPIYWLLLLVSVVLLIAIFLFIKKQLIKQKQQKLFLQKLADLQNQGANFIQLNQLLKGCALSYFPRREVASLHGKQWFDFLQRYSDSAIFENQQAFEQRLYQEDPILVDEDEYRVAKKWITGLTKQINKVKKDV